MRTIFSKLLSAIAVSAAFVNPLSVSVCAAEDWKPAAGPLMTRWAKDVTPENVHREYPRPQMVRKEWTNLNGLWDYAVRPKDEAPPKEFDGKILVPFPIESSLSGVMKPVGDANRLWYRRTLDMKKPDAEHRTLLHFGGVDWQTVAFVNGKQICSASVGTGISGRLG